MQRALQLKIQALKRFTRHINNSMLFNLFVLVIDMQLADLSLQFDHFLRLGFFAAK